jgi:hypothetical protein
MRIASFMVSRFDKIWLLPYNHKLLNNEAKTGQKAFWAARATRFLLKHSIHKTVTIPQLVCAHGLCELFFSSFCLEGRGHQWINLSSRPGSDLEREFQCWNPEPHLSGPRSMDRNHDGAGGPYSRSQAVSSFPSSHLHAGISITSDANSGEGVLPATVSVHWSTNHSSRSRVSCTP